MPKFKKPKLLSMSEISHEQLPWPLWQKVVFRFFFIYLALWITPWSWLDRIPFVSVVTQFYSKLVDWAVYTANAHLFQVKKELVPINGSGDTSYGWAMTYLFLLLALVGCIVWSVVDRKRQSYRALNYWLCLFTRYYVALVAFSYGIIKLFALQMPFPSLSMMATPLGDLLPMRLSWMFVGYSAPYQVFSGAMEVLAGTLLLFRKTATLGTLIATGVFANVVMLNLCYDVPVKIYSIHILLMCFFLLANEYRRLLSFLVLNKPTSGSTLYQFEYRKRWMRIGRIVLKSIFIIVTVGWVFYDSYQWNKEATAVSEPKPLRRGVYDVHVFAVNRDTLPPSIYDTLRWRDVILDNARQGSIGTADTAFRQIYHRAIFGFSADTNAHTISFGRFTPNSAIANFRYELPDSNTVLLWGKKGTDSLYVVLKKSNRHFQLGEKQFHWLSEANR